MRWLEKQEKRWLQKQEEKRETCDKNEDEDDNEDEEDDDDKYDDCRNQCGNNLYRCDNTCHCHSYGKHASNKAKGNVSKHETNNMSNVTPP